METQLTALPPSPCAYIIFFSPFLSLPSLPSLPPIYCTVKAPPLHHTCTMPSPIRRSALPPPSDYLQYFLSALTQQQAGALLFTDVTGSQPLFVARSQEAALRFIQRDSRSSRRPA